MITYKDELRHHGIKGQQWGVRRGPPYPIEDRVLRKGTKLNSITQRIYADDYKNTGKPMYTYRKDDEWDNKVYKGPFAKYKAQTGASWLVEHEYETVQDLIMPTKKERIEEFKALPLKQLAKDLESTRTQLVKYEIGNAQEKEDYKNIDLKKIAKGTATDKDWHVAYSIFNHAMEAAGFYKSTKAYMETMSKKYDAMVDDNNQGVYNNAHDPIIVFRAQQFLKTVNDTPIGRFLTYDEIQRNTEYVRDELAKEGKRVKL